MGRFYPIFAGVVMNFGQRAALGERGCSGSLQSQGCSSSHFPDSAEQNTVKYRGKTDTFLVLEKNDFFLDLPSFRPNQCLLERWIITHQ